MVCKVFKTNIIPYIPTQLNIFGKQFVGSKFKMFSSQTSCKTDCVIDQGIFIFILTLLNYINGFLCWSMTFLLKVLPKREFKRSGRYLHHNFDVTHLLEQ